MHGLGNQYRKQKQKFKILFSVKVCFKKNCLLSCNAPVPIQLSIKCDALTIIQLKPVEVLLCVMGVDLWLVTFL